MTLEEPPASVDLAPYTGCPHCIAPEWFTYPLSSTAAPEKELNRFDWKKYFWGTDWAGKQIIVHFGAVDYTATVWVNGQWAAAHEGGHTPFQADITTLLDKEDTNEIVASWL